MRSTHAVFTSLNMISTIMVVLSAQCTLCVDFTAALWTMGNAPFGAENPYSEENNSNTFGQIAQEGTACLLMAGGTKVQSTPYSEASSSQARTDTICSVSQTPQLPADKQMFPGQSRKPAAGQAFVASNPKLHTSRHQHTRSFCYMSQYAKITMLWWKGRLYI